MTKGCLKALILYCLLVAAYQYWGSPYWDPPATWLAPLGVGFITFLAIGALMTAFERWREWRLVRSAREGLPPRDGARAAVLGRLQPIGEPLLTPFSHTPAVMFEYELHRRAAQVVDGQKRPPQIGLGGTRCEPYAVADGSRSTRVLGMPDLTLEPEHRCTSPAHYSRARAYIAGTQYEDMSGVKAVRLLRAAIDVISDDDGTIEQHWLRDSEAEQWLHGERVGKLLSPGGDGQPAAAALHEHDDEEPFDEEDGELADEQLDEDENEPAAGSDDMPVLIERYLRPGEEVCMFGIYSELKAALVPSLQRHNVMLRMVRGKPKEIETQLRGSARSHLVGGLVALVVVHLAAWGATLAYVNDPGTRRAREQQLREVIETGDVAAVEAMLAKGQPHGRYDLTNSLLGLRDEPEMVALLLKYGADPNVADQYGCTPLMDAARYGHVEVLRILLAGGADIDQRSTMSNRTALTMALDAGHQQTAALLREAGARDDSMNADLPR